MKKKIIAGLLALTLAFSMTACGNTNDDTKETSKTERQEDSAEEENDEEENDEEVNNEEEGAEEEQEDNAEEENDEEVNNEEESDEEEQVEVESGTLEGNVYTNTSLGIQATIPEGFVFYTDEQMQEVLGTGAEMLEEANYNVNELEDSGTLYELMAETEDSSANLQIIIENPEVSIGRKLDIEQYASVLETNLKTAYQANGFDVESSSVTAENKNGLDFYVVKVSFAGMTQEYHITEIDGYMVSFTVTFAGTSSEPIQQFLDSITGI